MSLHGTSMIRFRVFSYVQLPLSQADTKFIYNAILYTLKNIRDLIRPRAHLSHLPISHSGPDGGWVPSLQERGLAMGGGLGLFFYLIVPRATLM